MTDHLTSRLAELSEHPAEARTWQPQLFRLNESSDRKALTELVDSAQVQFVSDTLREQLSGLLETREPSRKFNPNEINLLVDSHLGRTPAQIYGVWVFYPWSRRLAHVLPEDEYRELRTSRNRNKITYEEQQILRRLTLGIAGLSVGRATAVTLALEETGGFFRLADFDHLELSNMNRLRAGVYDLGINKAVLTAREIFEINPFAKISIFPEGVTEENLDSFLLKGGKLDILFEECDDLQMKVRLRERARELHIPVLMETSDRGLIDIERFDNEPDRPIFHGLTGELRAEELKGLTDYEKVPIVLKILGHEDISQRMAASLVDIEATLKTWPQLASAVALGGALNTDAARRIGLRQFTQSGRYYVDLEKIVCDGGGIPIEETPSFEVGVSQEAQRMDLPPIRAVGEEIAGEDIRTLVSYGTLAASGGNCQPWQFVYGNNRLRCFHDVKRSESFLDFNHCATYLAFGALAENISLVARAMGLQAEVQPFPDPNDPTLVCDVILIKPTVPPPIDDLFKQVGLRVTNRRLGKRVHLEPEKLARFAQEAAIHGARLQLLVDDDDLDAVADILGRGDRLRFLSKVMHREMMNEIRWSTGEVERTRDGLDVATLELTPTDLAGMRLISSWPVMKMVGMVGGGWGLQKPTKKAIAAASAVGLLTIPGVNRESFFYGGRALERIWLAATAQGLAFQPMTSLTYLFLRLEKGSGEGLSKSEAIELTDLHEAFLKLFNAPPGHAELMLFRIAQVGPPTARSLRLRVEDVLTFDETLPEHTKPEHPSPQYPTPKEIPLAPTVPEPFEPEPMEPQQPSPEYPAPKEIPLELAFPEPFEPEPTEPQQPSPEYPAPKEIPLELTIPEPFEPEPTEPEQIFPAQREIPPELISPEPLDLEQPDEETLDQMFEQMFSELPGSEHSTPEQTDSEKPDPDLTNKKRGRS